MTLTFAFPQEVGFRLTVMQQSLIAWILIGLIAGWLAGKVTRGVGFGCLADVALGLIGSLLGGWIFLKLGILGGGFLFSLAAATVGAILLVAIARKRLGVQANLYTMLQILSVSLFEKIPINHAFLLNNPPSLEGEQPKQLQLLDF